MIKLKQSASAHGRRLAALFGLFWCAQCSAAVEFLPMPGVAESPTDVQAAISQAWQSRGPNHPIRTHHRHADGTPHFANRLLLELSPYLHQHAHNPVNWYAWGDAAFEFAAQLDRPVLVSIGYSSCHWCHVIEEESYDDLNIARIINEHYVAVKVDRETHPDVDELYMLAIQVMGGNGGWPLHVFLTPQGKPFLGFTYVPKGDFQAVLNEVHVVWKEQRGQLEGVASQITDQIQSFGTPPRGEVELGKAQIDQLVAALDEEARMIDEFSPPTSSFPSESELFVLLDAAVRHGNATALKLAENRLTNMAKGGIRDHVGGGFHRYSIDNEWLVPHFEKMLYNQAHLARAYLEAYEITGKDLYRRVSEQTLDYALRDMRDEAGAFWSATDADSEGEEGRFFIWSPAEIIEAVGEDAQFVIRHFGVTEAGNFEGANILFLAELPEEQATKQGMSAQQYLDKLTGAVELLRVAREQREKPYLDDKIITAWNAMMITTLASSWTVLQDERYLNAARLAAEYLWTHAWHEEEGRLYRILRNGRTGEVGKLRDYAYLAEAMLAVHEVTHDSKWLDRAQVLVDIMTERFWDFEQGGFFSSAKDDTQGLIARQKDRFDEALPSGNSVAARSLAMLFRRTGQQIYARQVEQLFQAFAAEVVLFPTSFGYGLKALEEYQGGLIGRAEFAASGNAIVTVHSVDRATEKVRAMIDLTLAEDWHVQSDRPSVENLFATQVSSASQAWRIAQIEYPQGDEVSLSFQDQPLSVWSGKVSIPIELEPVGEVGKMLQLDVQLQACSNEVCLLPETVRLELPVGQLTG